MLHPLPLVRHLVLAVSLGAAPSTAPPDAPLQIQVSRVAKDVYVHTSYHRFAGMAEPYPSNGLVVRTTDGVLLIDTAWDEAQTEQLLRWVDDNLHQPVRLAVISHAHDDRLGGLPVLRARGIRAISSRLTVQRAQVQSLPTPEAGFRTDTTFTLGRTDIALYLPGAGHTPDNVVAWLPQQRLLFGGCLVKHATATSLGNTADADMAHWPVAVAEVQRRYPKARVVVPGHFAWGGPEALTHTLKLLSSAEKRP